MQDNEIQELLSLMEPSSDQQEGAGVYAIIDAAQDERIYPALIKEAKEHRCLLQAHKAIFLGQMPAVLAKAAPYLVRLRPGDLFSHWLISRGWGESWVIFIASLCSLDELLVHCRRFLMVKDESGKPFYFRYYDPRVLRTYLPSCNKQELTFLFDKVDSYYAESEDGREIYQYSLDQGALAKKTNPLLSQPQ